MAVRPNAGVPVESYINIDFSLINSSVYNRSYLYHVHLMKLLSDIHTKYLQTAQQAETPFHHGLHCDRIRQVAAQSRLGAHITTTLSIAPKYHKLGILQLRCYQKLL